MRGFAVALPLPANWRERLDVTRIYGAGAPPGALVPGAVVAAPPLLGFAKLLRWEAALATGSLWGLSSARHKALIVKATSPAEAAFPSVLQMRVRVDGRPAAQLIRRTPISLWPTPEEVAASDEYLSCFGAYGETMETCLLPFDCKDAAGHLSLLVDSYVEKCVISHLRCPLCLLLCRNVL